MLLLIILSISASVSSIPQNLEEVFGWSEVSFEWPNEETRLDAIKTGNYIPENNLPLGLEVWKDKLFITVPRWRDGVASTLNYVPISSKNKSSPLIPYPDWKSNNLPKEGEKLDENTIVSTFRLKADACDRLWLLDTGVTHILGGEKKLESHNLSFTI